MVYFNYDNVRGLYVTGYVHGGVRGNDVSFLSNGHSVNYGNIQVAQQF